MRVVHISPSALAGAPGMLSDALKDFGFVVDSVHFRAGDYGPNRDIFSPDSIALSDTEIDRSLFLASYETADVVHVHNFVPKFVLSWMASVPSSDKKFIYQVHSPRYERPIYHDLSNCIGIEFDQKLVIPHFHPRQYPDFKIIPNCLYRKAFSSAKRSVERKSKLSVHFSPSTKSAARWASKTNVAFEQMIKLIKTDDRIEVSVFEGVSPQYLAARRLLADITIDELVTGSYHLVSYEGLAAGSVVFNNADQVTMDMFQIGFQSPKPPFVRCSPLKAVERILSFVECPDLLLEKKKKSHEFFWEWMNPKRISGFYFDVYSG